MQPDPDASHLSDARLSEVADFLSEGIAVFDADGTLGLVNNRFRLAYPRLADVLKPGLPWTIFLREAVKRDAFTLDVSQQLDALESSLIEDITQSDPVRMSAANGQKFDLRLSQMDDGGFVLTQTEHIEQANETVSVRDAELLLRKVLEACPTSLTMSRVNDGQIIYRSPAATDLLGNAKSSFAHFAHREERADFVTLLLPDARVDNMRVTCLRPDGEEFPAEISARLIDYRGEDVIVANIEDLTQELNIKAEMDRQKEQLFQSEKLSALGELLAGVAHELNNPLSIIVGNAEILEEEVEETGQQRRVGKLTQAAHRCVRIVRSFLALARQEPLDLRPVDLSDLIDGAIDAVTGEAEQAKIKLIRVSGSSCPLVIADEVQLTQVVINLFTNAIQAIQHSGTGDEVCVYCTWDENTLSLKVSDNGPGISDDIKTRIFDPLFTTKDAGKGTGVGLAYCHRIISAHKGQIRLERTKKQGATFTVELPLAETRQDEM